MRSQAAQVVEDASRSVPERFWWKHRDDEAGRQFLLLPLTVTRFHAEIHLQMWNVTQLMVSLRASKGDVNKWLPGWWKAAFFFFFSCSSRWTSVHIKRIFILCFFQSEWETFNAELFFFFLTYFVSCNGPCAMKEKRHRKNTIIIFYYYYYYSYCCCCFRTWSSSRLRPITTDEHGNWPWQSWRMSHTNWTNANVSVNSTTR